MKKITKLKIGMIMAPAFAVIFSCGLFAPSEDAYLKNYSKAHEYMVQNRPEKAIPMYRKVLKQKEDFKNAYQEMAVCFQQLGQDDSAIVYYEGAIVYDPTNVDAYQAIGNIFYVNGDYDSALIWYDRGSEVDELYPRSYQNMGTIWLARKNFKMAKRYFEMAITVDATYPRGYYGLGLVALNVGEPVEAESRFLDAVRVGSMPEAIYMLGQMYYGQQKYEKSKEWFEKYLEKESTGQWAEKARDMIFLIEQKEER
jgi:tetratricopeptide (TPR) repeat protein